MAKLRALISVTVAVAFVLNLAGCATMFHGSSQQIAIRSNDPGADLYVNEAYIGRGNGMTVFKKNANYTITVKKDGCQTNMVPVSKSFDAITLLGVFIDFGLISILVIDGAATGSWTQFDQTNFVIDPVCAHATPVSPVYPISPASGSPEF